MFNSYEELMQAVGTRRQELLTIEVDMAGTYSQEHEDAKKELAKAEALASLAGERFLSDNKEALEQRVAETKPEARPVWIKYKRLDLMEWAVLMKSQNMTPIDQYEKVLNKTFVGVFGDPDADVPLSDDPRLLSSQGDLGILSGGDLHAVIQTFMAWQNSSGGVSIRPTKSGQD